MAESEIDYYRRRAIQEQVAAQKATCPTAQMIHDELAVAYRFRVSMLSDAWADAGVSIALKRLSRQAFQPSPPNPKESIANPAGPYGNTGRKLVALAG